MCSEPVTLGGGMTSEKTRAAAPVCGGAEDAGIDPPLRPMRLEPLGLVHFFNLHGGKLYDSSPVFSSAGRA